MSSRGILLLVLVSLITLSNMANAWEDHVYIESKTVAPGESDVHLEIAIENDTYLRRVFMPLVARTISGSAFWSGNLDTLEAYGRLRNDLDDDRIFDVSSVEYVSPDPFLLSYGTDVIFFHYLYPGPLEGMITLTFDVYQDQGAFEIDTLSYPPEYALTFVTNLLAEIHPEFTKGIITVCDCPYAGDPDASGAITEDDIQMTEDIIFYGAPIVHDPGCPRPRADQNCDSVVDILDYLKVWNVVYPGDSPCDPCGCFTNPNPCDPATVEAGSRRSSVLIEHRIVEVGSEDVHVGIYLRNDVALRAITLPLEIRTIDGDAFIEDTLRIIRGGRLQYDLVNNVDMFYFDDPATINDCSGPTSHSFSDPSSIMLSRLDSPDGFLWTLYRDYGACLLQGDDGSPETGGTPSLILEFNTNGKIGTFEIDTCCLAPGHHLTFTDCNLEAFVPLFTAGMVEVVDPITTVKVESKRVLVGAVGETLDILIKNEEDLESFTIPLVARTLNGGAFWTNIPSSLDTLPWYDRLTNALTTNRVFDIDSADGISPDKILLSAEKGAGNCLPAGPLVPLMTITFDVNSSPGAFAIDTTCISPGVCLETVQCGSVDVPTLFNPGIVEVLPEADTSLERVPLPATTENAYNITTEDFDGDENLDVVLGDYGGGPPAVFFGDGDGRFSDPVVLEHQGLSASLAFGTAYVNDDSYPDIIEYTGQLTTHFSNGNRTFSRVSGVHVGSGVFGFAVGYIDTSDVFVDVVAGGDVYLGDGNGLFAKHIPSGDEFPDDMMTVGLADMNEDGLLDVVVGGTDASIYLGDGEGNFTLSDRIAIGYAWGVQVSTAGNLVDFNEDGNADFVMMYPREFAGQDSSEVHVIFGDGDGQIISHNIILLDGTCYPVRVLDFDYDRHLDLAVGCESLDRIRIYRGDGAGEFSLLSELSTIPTQPTSLVVADLKEDGQWDFVVGDKGPNASAFLSTASPLPVLDSQLVTFALDYADVAVTNPDTLRVGDLGIHVAGARLGERDVDSNGILDKLISDLNLIRGTYEFEIRRRRNAPADGRGSLFIGINGHQLRRFMRNALLPDLGQTFRFRIPIGEGLEVVPQTGAFIGTLLPAFDWTDVVAGSKAAEYYEFQLDDYWDFASPEIVENTPTASFTPSLELLADTLYYWRFRSWDGLSWSEYSTTYAINTPVFCACDCHCDPVCDGMTNVLDVVKAVDVAFRGAPDIADPNGLCPRVTHDADCDGVTNVLDVVRFVNVAFRGGDPATQFCDPCTP